MDSERKVFDNKTKTSPRDSVSKPGQRPLSPVFRLIRGGDKERAQESNLDGAIQLVDEIAMGDSEFVLVYCLDREKRSLYEEIRAANDNESKEDYSIDLRNDVWLNLHVKNTFTEAISSKVSPVYSYH